MVLLSLIRRWFAKAHGAQCMNTRKLLSPTEGYPARFSVVCPYMLYSGPTVMLSECLIHKGFSTHGMPESLESYIP